LSVSHTDNGQIDIGQEHQRAQQLLGYASLLLILLLLILEACSKMEGGWL
jgi:hypothetical protein